MPLGIALLYGLVQGITELFPVSSLGHAVLIGPLFHLPVRESDPEFVPFLALLHLGTAAVLLFLYRHDWVRIVRGFVRGAISGRVDGLDEHLAMLLVVATVPAGLVGFLLQKPLQQLFADPQHAAEFLILNGVILAGAEILRRRRQSQHPDFSKDGAATVSDVDRLNFRTALIVGSCQISALIPGISRSGVTLAAGLLAGLSHREALRFAFLLATPIILAAGLLEVPQLLNSPNLGVYCAGTVCAMAGAYASAKFLSRFISVAKLYPYAAYCATFGIVSLIVLH